MPANPDALCPAVIIGTPSEIVKAILVGALVPLLLVAVNDAVNDPFAAGKPEIAPVLGFCPNPAGNPVALHEVTCAEPSRAGVVAVKKTPTLPEKLWPAVMIGKLML
jgi:hypothetical protein